MITYFIILAVLWVTECLEFLKYYARINYYAYIVIIYFCFGYIFHQTGI